MPVQLGFVDLIKLLYFGNYSHISSKHDKNLELPNFVERNKSILLNLLYTKNAIDDKIRVLPVLSKANHGEIV